MKPLKVLLALCALLLPAATMAACGGVSGSTVATVDGESIEMQSFDHWMAVAAKSSRRPNAQVPKPPDYAACISQKRKPADGQPKAPDSQLKQQCEQEYESLRDQVLQLLISSRWLEGEASDRGISVSEAEVEKAFDLQRKQSFPKDGAFERFLRSSGQTEQDVLLRVRLDLLSTKVQQHASRGKDRITDEQVVRYYRANKPRFGQPERRDLRIVLTESRAKAERARSALIAGGSWKSVVKQYSIDPASRREGGRLRDVAEGQRERALDAAVFTAATGRITGPVGTRFGYYLFEVTNVTRASRQTLEQAKPMIAQILAAESRQKALDGFLAEFRDKWRARTECREGYETQDCRNGPEATPPPAQTSGASRRTDG